MQLQQNLLASIRAALTTPRPNLIHLNADTTWLLQLPYPPRIPKPPGRSRYNILIDPWLRGRQSDVAAWFSSQWHAIDASMQTIAELNSLLEANEKLIGGDLGHKFEASRHSKTNYIDAVVVSHEFTDHCHRKTLLEIDRTTPVLATSRAARLIRSWAHFDAVLETPPFSSQNPDWRSGSLPILPNWLGISRIVSASDALYYHSAILVTFDLSQSTKSKDQCASTAEAVIYTPHGIQAQDLRCVAAGHPALTVLTLIHGLHDIRISLKQLNLGAHNGLQAQRLCNAKYWVSTHDEVKRARGFITPMLHRKIVTLKEALEEERRQTCGRIPTDSELSGMERVTFADLKSGESLLLL